MIFNLKEINILLLVTALFFLPTECVYQATGEGKEFELMKLWDPRDKNENTDVGTSDISLFEPHVHYHFAKDAERILMERAEKGLKVAVKYYRQGPFAVSSNHLTKYRFLQMLIALASEDPLYSFCTIELVEKDKFDNFHEFGDWYADNFEVNTELLYAAIKYYARIVTTLLRGGRYKSTADMLLFTAQEFALTDTIVQKNDGETLQWLINAGLDLKYIHEDVIEEAWKNECINVVNIILQNKGISNIKFYGVWERLILNDEKFVEFLVETQNYETLKHSILYYEYPFDKWMNLCFKYNKTAVIKSLGVEDYYEWIPENYIFKRIISDNDINILKEFVNLGFPIYTSDNEGLTLLFRAVQQNNTFMTGAILHGGGNINETSTYCNYSLLHSAAKSNFVYVAEELLRLGAPLELVNCKGLTPLEVAVMENNKEMIKMLSEKYMEHNLTLTKNLLHFAAGRGYHEAMEILIENGRNVNDINEEGLTPLEVALKSCEPQCAEVLIKHNAKLNNSRSGYHYVSSALNCKDIDILKYLLEKVIDLKEIQQHEVDLLRKAINVKNIRALTLLLNLGLNANAGLSEGFPPIVEAVRDNHVPSLDILLSYGAVLDLPYGANRINTSLSVILLHEGARYGSLEAVQWLLSKNRTVDEVDKSGNTALAVASGLGHIAVVKELISRGANVNSRNNEDGTTVLHEAAKNGHLFVVRELLNHKADTEIKDKTFSQTALHWAAFYGHQSVVMELTDRGANIEAVNSIGNTPLHVASNEGKYPIVMELLERGANINAKNKFGQTPLYFAEKSHQERISKALRFRGGIM